MTKNEQLAHRYLEILDAGDLHALDEVLSPEIYDHVGDRTGIEWWREILGRVGGAFPEARTTVHHILVHDDMVALHFTVEGIHMGRFIPQIGVVEPTGKPYAWSQVHIFRAADGLLVEHWAVRDDLGLANQVGVRGR